MCHLIREDAMEPEPKGAGATPPSMQLPRPRWIAAGAMALVGGLALAALVTPSTLPEQPVPKHAATAPVVTPVAQPIPVATQKVIEHLTISGGIDNTVDDGVPTSSEIAKAKHDCMEGM